MINFLRPLIEKKLSSLLGTAVTIDDLELSLLKRTATASGVRIAGKADSASPLLAMRAIHFELAIARMMQKQFEVKSLTLDQPMLRIVRHHDGSWNLPDLPRPDPADDADDNAWRFDLRKMLLTDGRIDLQFNLPDNASYRIELDEVLGDLTREGDTVRFTLIAKSISCGGQRLPGEARIAGRLRGVRHFGDLADAGLEAHMEIGDGLRITATADRIADRRFNLALDLTSETRDLLNLLPPVAATDPIRSIGITGPLRVSTDLRISL